MLKGNLFLWNFEIPKKWSEFVFIFSIMSPIEWHWIFFPSFILFFNIRLHVKWIGELKAFCIFDYPIVTQYFAQYRSMFNCASLSMSFVIGTSNILVAYQKLSKFWFWFWCFPIWLSIVFSHLIIMKPHVNDNIHPICYLFHVGWAFDFWKWKQPWYWAVIVLYGHCCFIV